MCCFSKTMCQEFTWQAAKAASSNLAVAACGTLLVMDVFWHIGRLGLAVAAIGLPSLDFLLGRRNVCHLDRAHDQLTSQLRVLEAQVE